MESARKTVLGNLTFKGKHLLSLDGLLEYGEDLYPRDIVFFEMRENMQTGSHAVIRMMLRNSDLFELSYAFDEVLQLEDSVDSNVLREDVVNGLAVVKQLGAYKKFTKSEKFTTKLFLGFKKSFTLVNNNEVFESRFYINIKRGEKTLVMGFSKIELLSMKKRFRIFAAYLDQHLWVAQKNVSSEKQKMVKG